MLTERASGSSRWAIMDSEDTPEVHVLPCNAQGEPLKPHVPSPLCACHPARDERIPNLLIHEIIQ